MLKQCHYSILTDMVKFLVMDVDGTLTDGKVYMGNDGEMMKAFDIKDGYALHTLLNKHSIIPIIITARKSQMVDLRCKELGITEIHQGVMNKLDCLYDILKRYSSIEQQYDLSNVAYIGDDLLDLQCMNPVKEAGGIVGCPSNAAKEVIAISDFVAPHNGGEGAVRDFVEALITTEAFYYDEEKVVSRLNQAIAYIDNLGNENVGNYIVSEDFFYNIIEYVPKVNSEVMYESHRKYIDIQRIIEGGEQLLVTDIANLTPCSKYDKDADVLNYLDNGNRSGLLLREGSCIVLFPKDGHKAVRYGTNSNKVKKIVGKLLIN